MTRWKYDAQPTGHYNDLRIPTIPQCPAYGYLAGFSQDSTSMPKASEVRMVASYIEFFRTLWFTSSEQDRFASQPFDIYPAYNTLILHKYAPEDWAYRRRMWPYGLLAPQSPRASSPRGAPLSLLSLLDQLHTEIPGEGPVWKQWKRDRPEVFPDAAE